jgi:hypothetical protein
MKKILTLTILAIFVASCSITQPYEATNNPIGSKRGTSKTILVFGRPYGKSLASGFVLNKNYGVLDAAKNGKINKIASVDLKFKNYFLFSEVEIIVTGE